MNRKTDWAGGETVTIVLIAAACVVIARMGEKTEETAEEDEEPL